MEGPECSQIRHKQVSRMKIYLVPDAKGVKGLPVMNIECTCKNYSVLG